MHWSLLRGPLPVTLVALALAGATLLVMRRSVAHWWTIVIPSAVAAGIIVAVVANYLVTDVWKTLPDGLPVVAVAAIAVIVAAIGLAVVGALRGGWAWRVAGVVAVLVIAAAALNQINRTYGYTPDLGAAIGLAPPHKIPLPEPGPPARTDGADPSTPPAGTREHGTVSEVDIPGTVSRFRTRPAWVYLPPAYRSATPPRLPVLMLLPGQPGSPRDWINSGNVATTMDAFAARHHGRAPIVVMPDPLGSSTANTMCVDSRLGNADTYLSRDVPDWMRAHLRLDLDTRHWAVGGFSFGGTCALQLAVAHPELFPTFLDISGQQAPTLGSGERSIAVAFGGDRAAYEAVQPLRTLAAQPARGETWRSLEGIFAVGSRDDQYAAEQRIVAAACRAAGVGVTEIEVPGIHSWYVAAAALPVALPRLAERAGLL